MDFGRPFRIAHELVGAVRNVLRETRDASLPSDEYARSQGVTVGKNCRLSTRFWGSEPFLITLGDNVIVSLDVSFLTHDASYALVTDERGRRYSFGRINVGSNVFIGAKAIILPHIEIGDFVVIGAGSVVTKSIPSGSVVAGNPARFMCTFDDFKEKSLSHKSAADEAPGDQLTRVTSLLTHHIRPTMQTDK